MTRACTVLLLVMGLLLNGETGIAAPDDGATATHSFADVAQWEKVFDDPARAPWQQPGTVIEVLTLKPGMVVADLGAGTGYFERLLSRAVGPGGAVLAVEVEPNLVTHLRDRAEREGTANVTPVLASKNDARLPAGRVDRVLVVDTYHHIDERVAYFRRLQAALVPGGRVMIVDWEKKADTVGPPVSHRLARTQVIDEMGRAGYRLLPGMTRLPLQYVLVFTPR